MKRILALMLIGIAYLSSCKKDNQNTDLLKEPKMDSVSKGSYFQIKFKDPQRPNDTAESFLINDLILNNQAIFTVYGNTVLTLPDSLYTAKIQIIDHKLQKISLDLSLFDSSKTLQADYKVFNNQSTLTDYTRGENKTYSIGLGSVVTIVHDGNDCVTGTFALNLYYNHLYSPATGSFKIFH